MEQDRRVRALKAAIQDGTTRGVRDRSVPDIMEAVEARLRADGRLWTDTEGACPEKVEDVDSKD